MPTTFPTRTRWVSTARPRSAPGPPPGRERGGSETGTRPRVPRCWVMLWVGTGQDDPLLQCSPVSPVFPAGILQPTLYDPEFPQ